MKQTITIKLKPYLQEYLLCKIDNPNISNKNIIGALMSPFLEYIPKDYIYKKQTGPEFITFSINRLNNKIDTREGIYISEENQKEFERILSIHFKDIFYSYINDKVRYRKQIKKCIIQFCIDYGITFNNINYETLKKSYYRAKNNNKLPLKMSLKSPLLFLM